MKKIDMATWNRAELYNFFSEVDYPFYAVTIPINVTRVKAVAKEKDVSFYHLMVWVCTKAQNTVPAFKMRIINDELYELDQIHPSFTTMEKGDEVFKIITMPWEDDIHKFDAQAKEYTKSQKTLFGETRFKHEVIYYSCIPWFDFTGLTNERNLDKSDAIPRIAWGKYYEEDGELFVHLGLEVNHRTIDGIHIGYFKEALDREIAAL